MESNILGGGINTATQNFNFTPHFKLFHTTFTTKPTNHKQMQILSLNQRFTLTFKAIKANADKISNLLTDNKFHAQTWKQTPFSGIIEFRVECNLRQAEIIRQLLKNFKTYE